MGKINKDNLRTPTSEEAREMQKKGVEKRKENKENNLRRTFLALFGEKEKSRFLKNETGINKIKKAAF